VDHLRIRDDYFSLIFRARTKVDNDRPFWLQSGIRMLLNPGY